MLSLIKNGESDQFEFKASFGREVVETLSAFANTTGGTVLIGVGDEGKITGVQAGHESVQQWVNQTKNSTLIPRLSSGIASPSGMIFFSRLIRPWSL
ncbi:MAG: helix-turn-helix domain-containing protein [Dissulfuribacterales bacterium]